ncbi:MAG: MerR family transcriptional regulator [bacterium]|nr:MerR family transcriptional regulator [bacterium]
MRNCERCGKLFSTSNPRFCPDCVTDDQKDFMKVRDFLKENPKISIEVISEATGVDELKIRDYIRQGQLELADISGPVLECSRCGKPIMIGNYCVICQREIQTSFKSGKSSGQNQSKDNVDESFILRYRKK